jgi:isoleucyl-tRNA synthetase
MDYRNTVFLPKTDFPMKANLSNREPELINYWQEIDIYKKLREQSKGQKKFILHFGPPYANGNIHIGHALTEVLKDVINKTFQMLGYDAPMVPGWDCHGLPIEWKIEEEYRAKGIDKDTVDVLEFRQECRASAAKWLGIQREEFQRLGIIADWKNPYSTMDFLTEARIVEQLGIFILNGSLYRGLKPVLWSVVEKTALAEAEVEYHDHTSDSVYVAFPIQSTAIRQLNGAFAVIWTTTPWTLPGNRAISYGPEFDYVVVDVKSIGKKLLIAKDLLAAFQALVGFEDCEVLATLKGSELKGTVCSHPFKGSGYDFDVPLLPGEHVTIETGTGLVHTAPGHGLEDFAVGKEFGIEVPETVQGDGLYYPHVPLFAGQHIFKANASVMKELSDRGCLLHSKKILHSYPHSWRSKAPLIYRTTAQWFVSMETNDLRKKALSAIEQVEWFPAQGQNRIRSMIQDRPDWCLSRQRAWGTPITIFVHKETGEVLRDPAVHARIVDAIAAEGADAWYTSDVSRFLGTDYKAEHYEKVTDTLDVWFDSGCSHSFVLKHREELSWPADVYLEGSDQHRGWFQSSLLESCGTTGTAPYRQVITHGFVLDQKGYKMSKSQGNVVAPEKVINTLGADLLRLWIASTDYSEDMRIGPDILKHQEDVYRRLRNTLRYLLGALAGFSETEKVDYSEMPSLERWVLHRLSELGELHKTCVEKYDFPAFYNAIHTFCAVDLSAFYFDIRKDCLYCDEETSLKRRSARTVMNQVFICLTHWLAPVLSFTAEESWLSYNGGKERGSIHLQKFPELSAGWHDVALDKHWDIIRDVRKVITGALEIERSAKTIGSSLQAEVAVYVTTEIAAEFKHVDLAELSITSDATLVIAQPPAGAFMLDEVKDVGVIVNPAKGEKCERCWKVSPDVGVVDSEKVYPNLCTRCHDVVSKQSAAA